MKFKTYCVDQNYDLIPGPPNLNKLGIKFLFTQMDCEYSLFNKEPCPKNGKIPNFDDCPLLVGDSPCKLAKKCKIFAYQIPKNFDRTRETKLLEFI